MLHKGKIKGSSDKGDLSEGNYQRKVEREGDKKEPQMKRRERR